MTNPFTTVRYGTEKNSRYLFLLSQFESYHFPQPFPPRTPDEKDHEMNSRPMRELIVKSLVSHWLRGRLRVCVLYSTSTYPAWCRVQVRPAAGPDHRPAGQREGRAQGAGPPSHQCPWTAGRQSESPAPESPEPAQHQVLVRIRYLPFCHGTILCRTVL